MTKKITYGLFLKCDCDCVCSFLIRVAASHDAVACGWQSDHVQYPHTAVPFLCGLVYFLLYFFGMAGALWYVNKHVLLLTVLKNKLTNFLRDP